MTIEELSQVRYLSAEIAHDKQRLRDLELKAQSTVTTLSAAPGGGKGVSDKVGMYAAQVADLKTIIILNERRCLEEKARLMRVINEAPDSLLREILKLRYIDCEEWNTVADRIGGYNTEDSVKKRVYRYLEKISK